MSTECTPPVASLLAELSLSSPAPPSAPSRAPLADADTGTDTDTAPSDGPRILQLSLPLPNTHLPTQVHLHLTITPLSILLFLTTRLGSQPRGPVLPAQPQPQPPQPPGQSGRSESDTQPATSTATATAAGAASALVNPLDQITMPLTAVSRGAEMGSFVLAMPDLRNPAATPNSTSIYIREASIETTTRIARILAAKTRRPCYVGNSMDFGTAGLGGSVEEVMEGIRAVTKVVLAEVEKSGQGY